jgi:hypothetical protein
MSDDGGTVLIPLQDTTQAKGRLRGEALKLASIKTEQTGRMHVVREDDRENIMFFVVPFYAKGKEGQQLDTSFDTLGPIVKELHEPTSKA